MTQPTGNTIVLRAAVLPVCLSVCLANRLNVCVCGLCPFAHVSVRLLNRMVLDPKGPTLLLHKSYFSIPLWDNKQLVQ